MALYRIESTQISGMSHTGADTIQAEGTVRLTDEEVGILIRLIREKGTTDIQQLGLIETYPALYETLRCAYYDMTYIAVRNHRLWEGYDNGWFDYDEEELMEYCREYLGFHSASDRDDLNAYYDDDYDCGNHNARFRGYSDYSDDAEYDDFEYDEDYDEPENEAFESWLSDYIDSLPEQEAINFFIEHMNASVDIDPAFDYSVAIPEDIIGMAFEKQAV